jgi:hypothetical protein
MNRRDEQITKIIERTEGLDLNRLESFYNLIQEAYMSSSIIDRIATVNEISNRTPSDYRVFSNQELRRIEHFNDQSYAWETYCKELGRSVALGEEAYIFETLQALIPDSDVVQGVGFEGIDRVVTELADDGHSPDIVLAPIAYMVGFFNQDQSRLEWDRDGGVLLHSAGRSLELFWSGGGRSLNRFIIFSREAGVWSVKLDPRTETRLTVAIGIQPGPPRGVLWLAETVAKYEVVMPAAFRSFRPDVSPDRDFDYVR